MLASLCVSAAAAGAQAYNRTITLNVPGITGDVTNYPLFVPLNAQSIDFDQAQPDGSDLRFTATDGKPLDFEIDTWDKAGKTAAVWVKLDVKGSTAFVMHWGNAGAPGGSNGKAVFSDAAGFLGAWHLGENGGTAPNGFKDASWFEAHGTGFVLPAATAEPGRIGKGVLLKNPQGGAAGQLQWIHVDNEKVKKEYGADEHPISVTGWFYPNSWGDPNNYQTMFARGDGEYSLQRDYQGRTEVCMSPASGVHHMCAITSGPPTKQWVHYMIMRKNTPYSSTHALTLWVNGEQKATTGAPGAHKIWGFGIGNNSNNGGSKSKRGFDGIIDEVRVMKVERTTAWAMLDYETQKAGSTALTFGSTSVEAAKPYLQPHAAGSRFQGIYDLRGRWLEHSRRLPFTINLDKETGK